MIAAIAAVPPPALHLEAASSQPGRPTAAGAFHVHTNRSDGEGSIDAVAAAAHRAGLQFVILTDHGDGTRVPERPAYRSGVLVIDGVEISTAGGHYATVGMAPSPFPIAGESSDVIEDVARLGGFGVASHGDSPESDLRWAHWTEHFDALEWLNLETVWRRATGWQVARASLGYWFRAPESLALAMARPAATFERLDHLARTRRVVALAATDAHGGLPASYEACFRTITTRVELDAPLRNDASDDARSIIEALRGGHHYTVVDAVATPGAFEFVGRRGRAAFRQGDVVAGGGSVTFESRVTAPVGTVLALLRDGVLVQDTARPTLIHESAGRPGAYRVEVRLASAPGEPPVPWIVSNPIFVGLPSRTTPPPFEPPSARLDLIEPAAVGRSWHTESDPGSKAMLLRPSSSHPALGLSFTLGSGLPRDQFSALVLAVPDTFATYDRLSLTAHASGPARLSVQLRMFGNRNPPRWRRSVYLDRTPRDVTVFLDDMKPIAPNPIAMAPRASIGGLMLVLDTTHTPPGAAGEVVFSRLALERRE